MSQNLPSSQASCEGVKPLQVMLLPTTHTHTHTHTPLKSRLLEGHSFQVLLPLSLQPAAAAPRRTEMVPVSRCTPAYHGEGRTQVLRPLQGGSAALLGGSKNGKREAEETSPGLVGSAYLEAT